MRTSNIHRFSSLATDASQLICCGVVLLGCTTLGMIGCSRQPELISPAAKAEPKADETPDVLPAKAEFIAVSYEAESDAAPEIATAIASPASTEPEQLIVANENTAIAEAAPAPNDGSDTPVKSDAEVQTIAVKAPTKDKEVKPATHVVDVAVPTASRRSSLDGPAKIAKVLLTEAEKKICKLKAGDKIPSILLPSLAGQPTELNALAGKKLTVITFWNPTDPYSTWELSDLTGDVLKPYDSLGVKVVGICSGTPDAPVDAATAQVAVDQAKAMFPCLVDADGNTLAQFGTERTSRTYLVDAEGKILWFDLEYSRSTRRELKSALSFLLVKQPPVKVEVKPATPIKKASPAKKPAAKTTKKPATK